MTVERHGSGGAYEDVVGYSRVVRADRHVWVAGCTAPGETPYEQMRGAIEQVRDGLTTVGAGLEDVVRTRMYVRDASRWQEVARAHAEAFGEVRPVTAMLEVRGFLAPWMQVEIEADAYLAGARSAG